MVCKSSQSSGKRGHTGVFKGDGSPVCRCLWELTFALGVAHYDTISDSAVLVGIEIDDKEPLAWILLLYLVLISMKS